MADAVGRATQQPPVLLTKCVKRFLCVKFRSQAGSMVFSRYANLLSHLGPILGANAQARASNIPEASQKGGRQSGVDERRSVDSGIATPSSWCTNARRASIRPQVAGCLVCNSRRSALSAKVMASSQFRAQPFRSGTGMMSTWKGMPDRIRSADLGRIGLCSHSS
jgi:hypothetical protein